MSAPGADSPSSPAPAAERDDAKEVDALLPKAAPTPTPTRPRPKASPEHVARLRSRARLMYAARFAQQGVCLSYLGIFLVSQDLAMMNVGLIYTILMGSMMLGSFTLPVLADRRQKHRVLALSALIIGTVSYFGLLFVGEHQRWYVSAVLIAFGSFWNGGFGPLVDAAVFQICAQHGCNFGELRLWGCVSWGISVLLTSALLDAWDSIDAVWWVFLGLSPFTFCATNSLMRLVYDDAGPRKPPKGKAGAQATTDMSGLSRLLTMPMHVALMVSVFATGALFATLNTYVYIWMRDVLDAPYIVIGVAFLAVNMCEVPCFLYSTAVHSTIGVHGVMYVSAAAYMVRLVAYAYFVRNAWWTILFEPMHALTFSLPLGTLGAFTTNLADEARAPRPSAQGFRQGTLNAGRAVGFLASAWLYTTYDPDVLFAVMAFTAVPILFASVVMMHMFAWYGGKMDLMTKRPGRPPR